MAISRKHKQTEAKAAGPAQGAGPDSASAAPGSENHEKQVVLRIPEDILKRVDKAVRDRAVRIPRHTWLLEAVVEKLEREEVARSGNGHGSQ